MEKYAKFEILKDTVKLQFLAGKKAAVLAYHVKEDGSGGYTEVTSYFKTLIMMMCTDLENQRVREEWRRCGTTLPTYHEFTLSWGICRELMILMKEYNKEWSSERISQFFHSFPAVLSTFFSNSAQDGRTIKNSENFTKSDQFCRKTVFRWLSVTFCGFLWLF